MDMDIGSFTDLLGVAQGHSQWSHWPFGPSFVGGWLNMLTKFIFIGLVLALMMYLLRFLFGPGGPMREDPSGDGDERQALDVAVKILRRRLESGEIDQAEFDRIQKLLRP
jgi:uncharacterized membrane protein